MWRKKKKKIVNDKRYDYLTEDGTAVVRKIEGISNKKDLFEMIEKILAEELGPINERGKHYIVEVEEERQTRKPDVMENKINSLMKDAEAREKLNELILRCKDVPDEEVMHSIVTVISAYMKANADRIGKYCFIASPKGDYHEATIDIVTNCKEEIELRDFMSNAISLIDEEVNVDNNKE